MRRLAARAIDTAAADPRPGRRTSGRRRRRDRRSGRRVGHAATGVSGGGTPRAGRPWRCRRCRRPDRPRTARGGGRAPRSSLDDRAPPGPARLGPCGRGRAGITPQPAPRPQDELTTRSRLDQGEAAPPASEATPSRSDGTRTAAPSHGTRTPGPCSRLPAQKSKSGRRDVRRWPHCGAPHAHARAAPQLVNARRTR